ncbi:Putative DH domain, DEP domain, CNH domain, pleckstrin domain, PH-like domain superfamily [Septoria linicola]|uniref:DH domain, DEP domain, CNH domain, pleckstrin domain, PH-like domain superfamily n=1 Tax=Septoria linicola TaxID=215465 RepID=A0A9Q9EKI2_9PEZI|nr:putative DH domain, DEP domain, CNH domain, pleckstrin domain, PH-like domain superfamily [Septoria linicola]USW52413.1 Putative DH domain, DEP domain, CNH domain, pleckstrin domain, PH-like domain superfamily [Septoria linicola]
MAYQPPQGRHYARNTSAEINPASSNQRDAAFSNIFGGPPPSGRSQTMTSGGPLPPQDRANTMSAATQQYMQQRAPPVRPGQLPIGYPRPPGSSDGGINGGQPQYAMNGQAAQQRRPPPQNLPQPIRPDRVPYGMPQRLEQRGPPPPGQYQRSFTGRPGAPGPALNTDSFRSQSLASVPRPNYQPPSANHQAAPAQAFRQQPYMNQHLARTTAQGRVVPDRPQDERTMSMSSYSRDADFSQTMSGRVIPNRRRESGDTDVSGSTMTNGHADPRNGYAGNGRHPSSSSHTTQGSRTMSMASTAVSPNEPHRQGSMPRSDSQRTGTMVAQKRPSLVYGAMLSNVASAFRDRVPLRDQIKDGLEYKNAFTGFEAVELIAYVIRTSDRNLALLLGRSLDAQRFFHEVTYAHRLRDSPNEVYQFKETINEEPPEVNGVFTLLTECYSPTCNRDNLCYSIACPRRLEQQQRLNMKITPGLKRETSRSSLHDEVDNEQKLWINTVSKEVSDSVSEKEKKRQEVISELMYTERDFVKDLEYLRDFWIKPLRQPEHSPIPEHRREKFIRTVFSNCQEVHAVNARMAQALTRRQQQNPVVRNVGDIFLEYVPQFHPFIRYGANQLFGKFEFEKEKGSNPGFARFTEQTERLKESRKLELNGYLTKPTTRLARYPLLLDNVLKNTDENNPDMKDIPKAIEQIRQFLGRVNEESGKAENHFNLMSLNAQLKWGTIPHMDLKLTEESRQLIFKSSLKKTPTAEQADVTAYLFDHAVLIVRVKTVNKKEEIRVYRKPIPLELLQIREMDYVLPKMGIAKRPSSSMIPGIGRGGARPPPNEQGFPITFKGLGKGGYELTLFCTSPVQREKWMEHIMTQKEKLSERHKIFTMAKLNEGFFNATVRVNCCRPIDGGRKLVIGTDFGVYICDRKPKDASQKPKRMLDIKLVTQLEVLEQHQIIIVLADKAVYSFPLEALEDESSQAPSKRGRRICHANYINAGMCNGQTLVCCVKSSSLSSTVKVFEPMDSMTKGKKKSGFAKMLAGGQEVLKPYKEFYIPMESNSIHFLRSKLCVGGAKGFEIVSLETLETQSLLDQADTSLDFVARRENVKPIYIERNTSEFLLCYNDFSFYVNKNGWRARGDWKILWEGSPNAFATWGEKYILAFEPEFIEIRQSDTGGLVCIQTHKNIRFLHQSTREILFAYEDEVGDDVIASLDFWGRPQSPQAQTK